MKSFFWAVVAVYLLLYFYAVYLYEGFTLLSALGVLALIGGAGWLLFRGWPNQTQNKTNVSSRMKEMKWYQSPFPYVLILISTGVVLFMTR